MSNASEDFPDPERPVKTISLLRGSSTVRFLRLCSRAPLMSIESVDNSPPRRLSYDSVIQLKAEHLFVLLRSEPCPTRFPLHSSAIKLHGKASDPQVRQPVCN